MCRTLASETRILSHFGLPNKSMIGWKWVGFNYFLGECPLNSQQICLYGCCGYLWVCVRGPKYLGHFGPPIRLKLGFSTILSKSLHWIYTGLSLHAHWSYLQRCVEYGPQGPNYWAILGPKIGHNYGFLTFSQEDSIILHQSCFA